MPAEVEADRQRAPQLLAELLAEPPAVRAKLAFTLERFRSIALVELLLSRAFQQGVEGQDLADLALAISGMLSTTGRWGGLVEQLRARLWGAIANARRLRRDLRGAENAFAKAAFHLASSADPLEESLFYRLRALLRRDQGSLPAAISHQERAVALLAGYGRPSLHALSLIELAGLHVTDVDIERTMDALRAAAALLVSELV